MSKVLERTCEHLFPSEGNSTVNVKFFPGNNRSVTALQFAEQMARADAQIENGTAIPTAKLDGHLTVTAL